MLISASDRCTVCANVPQTRKYFWPHSMELLGDMGEVDAQFGPVGDSANLDAI
jgi:hypothetical protein